MNRSVTAMVAAMAIGLGACSGSVNAPIDIADGTKDATATETVNGAIRVGDDVTVTSGSFRSVNGAATVGARSAVPSITLVNGTIRVGEDSRTGELTTVNGSVVVAANTRVRGGIGIVNGAITLAEGVEVDGETSAVNGRITLDGATVNGNIENVNGGVHMLGASVVNGDLSIRRPRGVSLQVRPSEVLIEGGARVTGRLLFEKEVVLRIHRDAQVGEIVGATPEYFGDDEDTGL